MTDKQRHVYNFIVWHHKKYGYSPSITDIQTEFGYKHHRSVQQIIDALVRKGFIEKPADHVLMPTYLTKKKSK